MRRVSNRVITFLNSLFLYLNQSMSIILLWCLYCEGMFRFGGGKYKDLVLVLIKFRKCNGNINKNIFAFE